MEILRARGVCVRRAGLGLPGLRLAGQGAPGRGAGHRGGGDGGPGAPARPRGRDRARHRRAHRRGHRPRPLRLEPVHRAHGLPAGRGGARPRRARRPGLRAHVPRRRLRGSSSWPCARPRRWRARSRSSAAAATVVVMAAAVSDYRPAEVAPQKVKKGPGPLSLDLVRTTDILRALGEAKRDGRLLVGFAAETETLRENARTQAAREAPRPDRGQRRVAARTRASRPKRTRRVLLDAAGGEESVPLMSKRELAERILDRVVALRKGSPRGRSGHGGHGPDARRRDGVTRRATCVDERAATRDLDRAESAPAGPPRSHAGRRRDGPYCPR